MKSPDPRSRGALTRWLENAPAPLFTAFAIGVAFSTYFCMYAFRKPFSAAQYAGLEFFNTGVDLKTAFVISQILGYTLSKYVGIKICSEVTRGRRLIMLIGMILFAEVALFCFGVLPPNLKFIAIFANGLPLGMVWGLVVWYLEGRQTSELLLAGLSCSFIVASGVVKDVGRWLMSAHGVTEFMMPFLTGLIFLLPFLLAAFLLNQLPDPTREDERVRMHREPMNHEHRRAFIRHFLPALIMLFIAYFFLTAYRDFRDNFGVEIFTQLGYGLEPGIFSRSETWVALGVLVLLGLLFLIRNNRWGLIGAYSIMTFGTVLMLGSTLLLDAQMISGLTWMILIGLGSYLAYVPYGSVLFDRMIASTRVVATAVFAIYLADALGYTGSIFLMIFKDIAGSEISRLDFFRQYTYFMSVLGTVLLVASCAWILYRCRLEEEPGEREEA